MIKIDKNIIHTILLLLIVGFLVYNYLYTMDVKTNIGKYRKKIDFIEMEVDSITNVNNSLDNKLKIMDNNINLINNEIKSVDKHLDKINKKTNEKIESVNNYSLNDMELFFANRYSKN